MKSSASASSEQSDLFPSEFQLGPITSILREELSPAGFAAIKNLGKHVEYLMREQQRKDEIRTEYFTLRESLGSAKEAQRHIMDTYELEYDLFDKIIYQRIGNWHTPTSPLKRGRKRHLRTPVVRNRSKRGTVY